MAAQPVPPSPDAEAERDVLYREYIAARTEAEAVKAERDALRAQLREIARLWDMPSDAMPQDWRDLWRAAIDAARKA